MPRSCNRQDGKNYKKTNDDSDGKPAVGIHTHIGCRPMAAFGNSDGDLTMLQWTSADRGARLAVIVRLFLLVARTVPLFLMMIQYYRAMNRMGSNESVIKNPNFQIACVIFLLGTILIVTFSGKIGLL